MMVSTKTSAGLVTALGLAGCRTGSPTHPPTPAPEQSRSQAEAPTPKATASASEPADEAEPTDVVKRSCVRLAAQSQAVLREPWEAMAEAALPSAVEFVGGLGVCHFGQGGAWMLVALDMETWDAGDEDDPSLHMEGAVQLAHVAPDGSVVRNDAAFLAQINETPESGDDETLRILGTHDYDGDGVDEVVLETARSGYDLNERKAEVASLRSEDADVWIGAPEILADIAYETAIDHDGDGVYELVSEHEYWSHGECFGMSGQPDFGNPPVLYHATEQGTFSASDDVAADFLREQCPELPDRLLVGGDHNWELAAMHRIACARIWGQSAQEVIARIGEEWPTLSSDDLRGDYSCQTPRSEFEDEARIDPPLVLTP